MKSKESNKCILLNEAEVRNVNGGFCEPTPEELEAIRKIYGPFAEYLFCW